MKTLLITLLLVAVSLAAVPRPDLQSANYGTFGKSMHPTIPAGYWWVVLDRTVPLSAIRVGDIVGTWHPSLREWWPHRVISIRRAAGGERVLITKGDANMERDVRVTTADNYLGLVRPGKAP